MSYSAPVSAEELKTRLLGIVGQKTDRPSVFICKEHDDEYPADKEAMLLPSATAVYTLTLIPLLQGEYDSSIWCAPAPAHVAEPQFACCFGYCHHTVLGGYCRGPC